MATVANVDETKPFLTEEQCLHCKKGMMWSDGYCNYCGRRQKDENYERATKRIGNKKIRVKTIAWISAVLVVAVIVLAGSAPNPVTPGPSADTTGATAGRPVPSEIQPVVQSLGLDPAIVAKLDIEISSKDSCARGDSPDAIACFQAPNKIVITPRYFSSTQTQQNSIVAHEYLHYVWSTLSNNEKADLAASINQVYVSHASYLNRRLLTYTLTDALRLDELHSYIGTELSDSELPAPLLSHYMRYVPNRGILPSYN